MNRLRYLQLTPGHEEQFHMAKQLWFSFIHEVHEHDGIQQPDHQIVDGLKKKSPYKAVAKICTLNWRLWLMSREAFQCLRLTLERDMVYRRKVTEQLWGCTFDPTFAERGGTAFYKHIKNVLSNDGASKMYICPDAIGVPFWKANGYMDSGKIDPDARKPIYIKEIAVPADFTNSRMIALTKDTAAQISQWEYEKPFDVYNFKGRPNGYLMDAST